MTSDRIAVPEPGAPEVGVGDRVRMRYGVGTVLGFEPDASGRGRPCVVWVGAHGQAWVCEQHEISVVEVARARG